MGSSIKIGVSACLLGENVRYDGGHKLDRYIVDTLGRLFTFVPVCPEVGAGMPTPREPMRLEGDSSAPRLMTRSTGLDMTEQMLAFCEKKLDELARARLCGFIFKKGSPSSGLYDVSLFAADGALTGTASGLFAAAFVRRFPEVPVEEDEGLSDPALAAQFIERVQLFSKRK